MATALYNRTINLISGINVVKACWIAIFFSALLISGCGQKGSLYLPDEAPEQTQQQSQ